MIDVYRECAENEAAGPVIVGKKSATERFAGADETYTIEAMMGDGKALQSGTSHNLGRNFAEAFEIKYLDKNGVQQHCWTTSWGLSTRFIGAIIMTHGDDQGLVLPPRLAPHQVVIVPIFKTDDEKKQVFESARAVKSELTVSGIRAISDERDGSSPGFKFNDWEMRGVPLRIEIGPKDIAKGTVVLARRDKPGKEGKSFVPREGLAVAVAEALTAIQKSLYNRALDFRTANTTDPGNYAEFKQAVEKGFCHSFWCGGGECEKRIKEDTKATLRCIPMKQAGETGKCIYCGNPAGEKVYFAKSY
jgi:prolyl-tRNA synthetase